jgi:signal transduction histidine kinase
MRLPIALDVPRDASDRGRVRIATRLWLVFIVQVVVVLAVGVTVRVREEERLVLDLTLRDRRFFAHALQATLVRPHGSPDPLAEARAMLDREEVAAAHIVARLVSETGSDALPRPLLDARMRGALRRDGAAVGVVGDEIVTYVALDSDAHLAIELREPHAVPGLLARVGLRSLMGQAMALAALAGVVTFALVGWLVGRPLGRLAEFARRVGAGDLGARVPVLGGDGEMSTLAVEMNHMAERLDAARHAVDDANAERLTAMDRLRHADRLRTVGELASALAHELGTPLNVVSGHARLIEQDPAVSADVRDGARTVLEQSARMTRTLRDLLDFSRRRGPQVAEHDLGELADRAARTLEPLTKRRGVRVEVAHAEPVRASVDAQQVLQVLTNLLVNAAQAMPHGGGARIAVEAVDAAPPTGVHAPAGRYARIAVEDDGVGIAAEDVPRLFEPFFTRKAEGEGTGLGLSVVEGIVRDHRGWVTVTSEVGRGSRFEVFLPVKRA